MRLNILKNNYGFQSFIIILSLLALTQISAAQNASSTPSPSISEEQKSEAETRPGLWNNFHYVFEAGGQFRDVDGDRPSKFEQYKDVRKGFIFRRFNIYSNPAGERSYFYFVGRNASELDQQYRIEGGSYGRFRTKVDWSAQPLLYSRGASTLLTSTAPGVYTVPDAIQQNLQSLDPPFTNATTTPNPALIAAVRTYFSTSANTIDVRTQRQTLSVSQEISLTKNWKVRFRVVDYRRFGERGIGTGSYERTGTSLGDTFRAHLLELPGELSYRTTTFTVGTSYVTRNWGVNFDYKFQKFSNEIESYVYDNPFRITDQQANSSGAYNRMAFARGIHGASPDNKSFGFMITAFVNLPRDSRWAGAFGWNRWKQDAPFLPYTLNTAIVASNLGGQSPTNLSTLPEESLKGAVDSITLDQLFTTQLLKNLRLNLHYRSYNYRNKTEEILFPGYAAYLESAWRTSIVGSYGTRLIENEPVSYLKQTATGEIDWEITDYLKWRGEYEWEGWNAENRQVARSNEHKFGTFLTYKPTKKIKTDLDYRYQTRKPQSYYVGPLENQSLRMFDQAQRLRHDVRFKWQWALTPQLGVSGNFNYLSDDYDDNFFGTSQYIERSASVDLLYNPRENMTLYANYSREHYNTSLQSIAKTAVPFDIRNRWNRDDRNINDNFGIGLTTYLAKSKWFVDVNYAYNSGRNLITTANLTPLAPTALLNAAAFDFPESKITFQEFSLDANYQVSPNVAIGFRYFYEPFRLDDWQLNGLDAYPVDQLAPETDGRRFLLLNSRYTDHNAHIFSFYIRFGK
jgi:MtrB/PioB family decaheme-associated outer membrane protein